MRERNTLQGKDFRAELRKLKTAPGRRNIGPVDYRIQKLGAP
jgi:hypothetical protein